MKLKEYIKVKTDGLDSKIANIQLDVNQLKTLVMDTRPFGDSQNVLSLDKLKQILDVTLPMETYEEFCNFNLKIVDDNYDSLVSIAYISIIDVFMTMNVENFKFNPFLLISENLFWLQHQYHRIKNSCQSY